MRNSRSIAFDLRVTLRQLRRSPGFAVLAVLTLALGMGATTAIFTLFNAALLTSLPVSRPSELYLLGGGRQCCVMSGFQKDWALFSAPLFASLRDQTPELDPVAAFQADVSTAGLRRVGSNAPAVRGRTEYVTGNYFTMLGVHAAVGRVLDASDDRAGAPPTAVLSYRTWSTRYEADPAIVGSAILVNGLPVTITGVAPPKFYGDILRPDPTELWIELAAEPILNQKVSLLSHADKHWLRVMGRVRSGQHPEAIAAKLTSELRAWLTEQKDVPAEYRKDIAVQTVRLVSSPAGVPLFQEHFGGGLKLLLALSAGVLLIACSNLANLLLARAAARKGEVSVRLALGASRGQVVRQTLGESLILALLGGIAGTALAFALTRTLLALAFNGLPPAPIDPAPSLRVLLFSFSLSLLTGLLFGSLPAWLASRFDPAEALRAARRATRDRASISQRFLVVGQAALSLVLLAGAGLLSSSLERLEHQNFGFVTTSRLSMTINPHTAGYTPERLPELDRRIEERLGSLPGVQAVGLALYGPLQDQWSGPVYVAGRPASADGNDHASWNRVSTHFLEAVGEPILRGRSLSEEDTISAARVAVVNETFVRLYASGREPIGLHFGGSSGPASRGEYEIVGVARDAKYFSPEEPVKPMYFLPLSQNTASTDEGDREADVRSHYVASVIVKTQGSPTSQAGEVRRAMAAIDPNLTVFGLEPFAEQVSVSFNEERLLARITTLFGILALTLAAIGLYGVMAYVVTRRTSEIGIRMALGAGRWRVLRMILGSALGQVLTGIVIGLPIALAGGRMVASQLYDVKSWDPVILSTAAGVLVMSALGAAYWPARCASTVDPAGAVRAE
jgi:predicted permease